MSVEPRSYCPGCEPQADPLAEILDVCYCGAHYPYTRGLDDHRVAFGLDPGTEAEQSRALCAFIHRSRQKK